MPLTDTVIKNAKPKEEVAVHKALSSLISKF